MDNMQIFELDKNPCFLIVYIQRVRHGRLSRPLVVGCMVKRSLASAHIDIRTPCRTACWACVTIEHLKCCIDEIGVLVNLSAAMCRISLSVGCRHRIGTRLRCYASLRCAAHLKRFKEKLKIRPSILLAWRLKTKSWTSNKCYWTNIKRYNAIVLIIARLGIHGLA